MKWLSRLCEISRSKPACEIVTKLRNRFPSCRAGAHEFRSRYVSAEPCGRLCQPEKHEKRIRAENDVLVNMYNSPGKNQLARIPKMRGRFQGTCGLWFRVWGLGLRVLGLPVYLPWKFPNSLEFICILDVIYIESTHSEASHLQVFHLGLGEVPKTKAFGFRVSGLRDEG